MFSFSVAHYGVVSSQFFSLWGKQISLVGMGVVTIQLLKDEDIGPCSLLQKIFFFFSFYIDLSAVLLQYKNKFNNFFL